MNLMTKTKLPLIVAMIALATMASGCVLVAGNKGNSQGTGTLGQQLIDLKKAKDAGVLSDAEYATQREKLLCEGKHKH